jgi:predicted signal transduction protein with EAL and GGDEF domain
VVLVTVAARVAKASEDPNLVGRGSGDEFLIVLPDLLNDVDAGSAAEVIRNAVRGSVMVGEQSVMVTVGIGVVTGNQDADAEQLVRNAGLAMRQAKAAGRDRTEYFDPRLALEAQHRVTIEANIRVGLERGEFVPWVQPIVGLIDEQVAGYECLVRWMSPSGVQEPASFLHVATRTSLINDIDLMMLRRSIDLLARIPAPLFVSVNVTGAMLSRVPYADLVIQALHDSNTDPSRLHLELTETVLLSIDAKVTDAMRRLASVGVRWYVDDFGTGYSSITHLRDLPIAGLKLDMSFTRGIRNGERTSIRLATALKGLAEGLELDTVAEGVETTVEADHLRETGWVHAQGWLFGRAAPLPGGTASDERVEV